MKLRAPLPSRLLVVAFAAALTAACGGGDGEPATSPSPATTTEAVRSPASTPAPTGGPGATSTSTPTPPGVSARLTVSGGQVEGPGELEVPLGEQVTLTVTSDRADEIHVHGYDLTEDVAAGDTVSITFTADIPGQFEVELEQEHRHLIDLVVR